MRGQTGSKKHDSKTASRPPWVDDFEDAIDSVSGARNRSDMLNRLLSAWKPLRDGLEEDVSTLDAAQETIGEGPPFVRNCIWDILNGYRGLLSSSQDSTRAREATEFVAELLDVFDGESERVKSQWLSERAYFLRKAGDTGSAMALCDEIIADYPTRACGYCTLSDIHESTEPPRYKEALDVLLRAQDAPVEDGDDWDLASRIAWLRDTLEEQSWRESEHFVERSEFFDTFDRAELDKKLDMARDRIENAPDFDGEWAFQLMVEGVRPPCIEQRRGSDWLDLLDLLREQHPDIARQESGYLANSGLGFALDGAPERVAPLVDMLFAQPVENIDFIVRNVEVLASRGWSAVHRHLIDAWDDVGPTGHLSSRARVEWANWALYAQLAAWADEDIDRSRSVEELTDALGPLCREIESSEPQDYLEPFLGEQRPDAGQTIDDFEVRRACRRMTFLFAHDLVAEHGWSAFEAIAASNYLEAFLDHCDACEDPFSDRYGTREAGTSRTYRAKLKKIRDMWDDDFRFSPHPDLAVGWARAIAEQDMLGHAPVALSFFAAAAHLAPWLDERGLIENAELTGAIQEHFALRSPEVIDQLRASSVFPWLLDERLEATRTWLDTWTEK